MDTASVVALIGAGVALIVGLLSYWTSRAVAAEARLKSELLRKQIARETSATVRDLVWQTSGAEYLRLLAAELRTPQSGLISAGPRALTMDELYVWSSLRGPDGVTLRDDAFFSGALESMPRRVLIIGGPGSGKTTLVRRWASMSVDPAIADSAALTPLFVPLRVAATYPAGSFDLVDAAIAYVLAPKHFNTDTLRASLHLSLQQGRAIAFLDGADEVPIAYHGAVADSVKELSTLNDQNIVIVTSRPTGFHWGLTGFQGYDLQEFGDAQQNELIDHWIPASDTGRRRRVRAFVRQKSKVLLASNPLYLTMLCELALAGRKLVVPNAAALFEQFIWLLLQDWPVEARHELLTYPAYRKTSALQELANQLWSTQEVTIEGSRIYSSGIAGGSPDLPGLINEIVETSGILRLDRSGRYSFLHPLFQEFFVAKQIVDEIERKSTWESADEFYASHPIGGDRRFQNVIAFVRELREMRGAEAS